MKKMLFIMNPFAGKRKANRHLADILTIFNRANYDVTVYMTAGPGDATAYTEKFASQFDIIVCCGGDGTLNEAINGLRRCGAQIPLGYIPAGSTNDFASSLNLSTDPIQAARDIAEGSPRQYDVCRFGDRYFSYVASFGAFTKSSYATPQSLKNVLGHTAYLLSGIREITQIHKLHVRMELEDQTIEDDFIFGAICNSTSVGGILTLAPDQVDMGDGLFELFLIRAPKKISELAQCIHAIQTQKYNCSMITFISASKVKVIADLGMDWTLDGEMESGHEEVDVDILHHAISIMQKADEV